MAVEGALLLARVQVLRQANDDAVHSLEQALACNGPSIVEIISSAGQL